MPPVGFEPAISAGERLQTYALDRAATGTGAKQAYGLSKLDQVIGRVSNCVQLIGVILIYRGRGGGGW